MSISVCFLCLFVCLLGCISGLFFPEAFIDYKEYTKVDIDGAKNSQGREQMHSILDKLGKSLRQENYFNALYDSFLCYKKFDDNG